MWVFSPRRNCSLSTLAEKKSTWMRSMTTAIANTKQIAIGYMPKPPPFQCCATVSKIGLILFPSSAEKSSKPTLEDGCRPPSRPASPEPPRPARAIWVPLSESAIGRLLPLPAWFVPDRGSRERASRRRLRFVRVRRSDGARSDLSQDAARRAVRTRTCRRGESGGKPGDSGSHPGCRGSHRAGGGALAAASRSRGSRSAGERRAAGRGPGPGAGSGDRTRRASAKRDALGGLRRYRRAGRRSGPLPLARRECSGGPLSVLAGGARRGGPAGGPCRGGGRRSAAGGPGPLVPARFRGRRVLQELWVHADGEPARDLRRPPGALRCARGAAFLGAADARAPLRAPEGSAAAVGSAGGRKTRGPARAGRSAAEAERGDRRARTRRDAQRPGARAVPSSRRSGLRADHWRRHQALLPLLAA